MLGSGGKGAVNGEDMIMINGDTRVKSAYFKNADGSFQNICILPTSSLRQ